MVLSWLVTGDTACNINAPTTGPECAPVNVYFDECVANASPPNRRALNPLLLSGICPPIRLRRLPQTMSRLLRYSCGTQPLPRIHARIRRRSARPLRLRHRARCSFIPLTGTFSLHSSPKADADPGKRYQTQVFMFAQNVATNDTVGVQVNKTQGIAVYGPLPIFCLREGAHAS
jgi:hypothetical protein